MPQSSDLRDLGYQNGWREWPEIVKKCHELNHDRDSEHDNVKCVARYWCDECGYEYRVDSSD